MMAVGPNPEHTYLEHVCAASVQLTHTFPHD